MIGLVYVLRSIYSILYIQFDFQFVNMSLFWDISLQAILNMVMDISSIMVVLILNRKTIKLRRLLEENKKQKDKDILDR